MAAAAILPEKFRHKTLTDSKQLSEHQREDIYAELTANADFHWAVGVSDVDVIDHYNILRATWRAMQFALDGLKVRPDHVLVDGLRVPLIGVTQTAIVKGDAKSFSIAAASVIAKVTRDRMMLKVHEQFPQYNFARHKGYGTPEHLAALGQYGPSPVHRRPSPRCARPSSPCRRSLPRCDMFFGWFQRKEDRRTPRQITGARRESRGRYLRRHGYKVLLRNFRSGKAEVDIVARDKDWLVFVEVKTRETEEFGAPSEAVDLREAAEPEQGGAGLSAPASATRESTSGSTLSKSSNPRAPAGPTISALIQNAFDLSEPYIYLSQRSRCTVPSCS